MLEPGTITTFLSRGDCRAVLSATVDGPDQSVPLTVLHVVVGALTATGRAQEAETLFRHKERELDALQLLVCRYHLSVAYTRAGFLARSRRFLGASLQSRHHLAFKTNPAAKFYIYFALAFHRFFAGRLTIARRSAQLAYKAAQSENSLEHLYLSAELLGQIQFIMGEPIQALTFLREAQQAAIKLEHVFAPTALAQQIVQQRVRLNQDLQSASMELNTLLKKLPPTDVYGRAALKMERARFLGAQGYADQAKALLNETYEILLTNRSRRYEITRALRMADLMAIEGDWHLALQQLDLGATLLDRDWDLLYEVEILARRAMFLEKLELRDLLKATKKLLKKRVRRCGASTERMRPPDLRVTARSNALNHRQIDIVRMLEGMEFIDVKTVRELFQVSEITACRDLTELAKNKLVERVGRARATKYRLRVGA